MASLAVGLAGAAIGGSFGFASLGFTIGSIIGTLLFPPSQPDTVTVGPRLGDKSITSSAYGEEIPLGYGVVRLGGQLIWSSGIREQEHVRTQSAGGKGFGLGGGGGSQTQITYTYFASFAIAFAEGEADKILRIWMNNEIVYDITAVDGATKKEGVRFRFYKGDENQLPDSLIEADVGDGLAPAHRGLVYIVFDDLPLADFGNRLPNVQAEIAFDATTVNTVVTSTEIASGSIFNAGDDDTLTVDFRRNRVITGDPLGTRGFRFYGNDDLVETRQQNEDTITADSGGDPITTGPNSVAAPGGPIFSAAGSGQKKPIVKINPLSLVESDRYGDAAFTPPNVLQSPVGIAVMQAIDPLGRGLLNYVVVNETNGLSPTVLVGLTVLDGDNMELIERWTSSTDFSGAGTSQFERTPIAPLDPAVGRAAAWVSRHEGGNNDLQLYKVSVDASLSVGLTGPTVSGTADLTLVATISASAWNSDGDSAVRINGPVIDEDDDGLLFFMNRSSSTGCIVFKWKEGEGVVWTAEYDGVTGPGGSTGSGGYTALARHSRARDGVFGFAGGNGHAMLIDTTDGSAIIDDLDVRGTVSGDWPSAVREQFFDPVTTSITCSVSSEPTIRRVYLNRATGFAATLSDIVTDISDKVGLEASDLDVTELTDSVQGYVVGRQMNGRDAIEQLATAYFFDGVESDGVVDFKKRGRASTRTLTEGELVVIDDETADVLTERRIQEVELPERLTVVYMDEDIDYQQNSVSAKRIKAPASTMRAADEPTIPLAIVMTATEAQQIAERLLFTAWNERVTNRFRTGWEHLDLDPADVVGISLDSGTSLEVRIVDATVNADLTVSFEALREDSVTVVSDSVGQGALGVPVKALPTPGFTKLFLFDIPLLRDVDDAGNVASRFYLAMNAFTGDWPGGSFWESSDGAVYDPTGVRVLSGVTFGTVQNELPTTDYPFQTDTTTELTVWLEQGDLASVTNSEFLNNANAALVGDPSSQNWEVILFRDVTENGNGSYTLSHIMRARRGTDTQVNTHGAGETFIFLDRDTMQSYLLDTSLIGNTRFYKGVGFNQIPERADTESFVGNGTDLKPYAPCLLDAVVDGSSNIDLSWERRTRVGGELKDGTGTVPLSEESESYSVDIKDGPSGTVLRTLTSATTSVQYDAADITTDFGSTPATLTFEVFQVSATVGRGFGKEATITL